MDGPVAVGRWAKRGNEVDEKECYDNGCNPTLKKWVDKMEGDVSRAWSVGKSRRLRTRLNIVDQKTYSHPEVLKVLRHSWLHSRVALDHLKLDVVAGEHNPADRLTKALSGRKISRVVRTCRSKTAVLTANLRSIVWSRTSEQGRSSRRWQNARGRGSSGERLVFLRWKSWCFLVVSRTVESLWPGDLNESLCKSALEVLKRTLRSSMCSTEHVDVSVADTYNTFQ